MNLCNREKQEGEAVAEKKSKLPDWLIKVVSTIVLGIGTAMVNVWNDNIVTKQEVITLKADKVRLERDLISIRTELNRQGDHNGLILEKLEDIADSHRKPKRR